MNDKALQRQKGHLRRLDPFRKTGLNDGPSDLAGGPWPIGLRRLPNSKPI